MTIYGQTSSELIKTPEQKHSHYHKPCPFDTIDVYRVFLLWSITDPCIQHAMKKLFVAGGRGGGKDISKDIRESIESLERWEAMRAEEAANAVKA